MKIAVYGRNITASIDNYISMINVLKANKYALYLYADFAEFLLEKTSDFCDCCTFSTEQELTSDFSFFVSFGGDGTFLEATRFIQKTNIPIIGINTGSLGFLASVSIDEFNDILNEIMNNEFEIENRSLIHVETVDKSISTCALNEITLQRKMPELISTTVKIGNELLSQCWSDGLIIATPTGSTAYSLSIGGPVVVPSASVFIISPIAPHNLAIRPFVVADDVEIKIKLHTRGDNAMFTADTEMHEEIASETEFIVKKSPYKVNIIKPNNVNFYRTLRNKLMWGYDIRNDINVYQHFDSKKN